MTEKDRKLIERARKELWYIDWPEVSNMAKKADTEEARQILEQISKDYYRKEEAELDRWNGQ